MTPFEFFLSKMPGAKRNGKGWIAKCPAHEDQHPSLSISEGNGGRALVHCHAGCTPEKIVAALGMRLADLMPEQPFVARPIPRQSPNPAKEAQKIFRTANEAIVELERHLGKRSNAWAYSDSHGKPVGFVVRWDTATGKEIRPVSRTGDGWTISGMPEPRPLYRLPELVARPGERVFVCEGEKAADATVSIGLLATTSPHGSKSAAKADWTPLAGREVVILPDHDEAGKQYAGDVANILEKLTPPATVRIVKLADAWPDLPAGGDIADVVAAGEDADTIKVKLARLVDKATSKPDGPVLVCLADVEPREIKWLWPDRIPLGRITLLVGRPGEGKSFLGIDIASRVTVGRSWPDGSGHAPQGSVILITAEDDPADTIRPRLDAHYADVRRVHLLSAVRRTTENEQTRETLFTLMDVEALETSLKRLPDCKLIVVDPIGSFLGYDVDCHRDNEVRSVLAPVARLAERYGPAILVIAHRRKNAGTVADDLAIGSRAFTGVARAVWHLTRARENRRRRLLLPGKNNLGPEGTGLAFVIDGNPPAIFWEADPISMTADDALALENEPEDRKPGPKPEPRNRAAEWLHGLLKSGPLEANVVKQEAEAAGFVWRTVQRAAETIGLIREKRHFGNGWTWKLPSEDDNRRRQDLHECDNLSSCHLRENRPKNAVFTCQDDEDDKFSDLVIFADGQEAEL